MSSWIEDRFPHRSVTHSLVATVGLAAIALPIALYFGNWKAGAAVPLGHALSCFSDCFTRQGVQLFWPDPAWAISVSNPHRRLTTGGPGEYWVLQDIRNLICYEKASLEGVPVHAVRDRMARIAWGEYEAVGKEIMEAVSHGG